MGVKNTSAAQLVTDYFMSSIKALIEEDEALSRELMDKYLGVLKKRAKYKGVNLNMKVEE